MSAQQCLFPDDGPSPRTPIHLDETPDTFGALASLYFGSARTFRKASTVHEHETRYRITMASSLGTIPLSHFEARGLGTRVCQRWLVEFCAHRTTFGSRPVSTAFVHNCFNTLCSILTFGVTIGVLSNHPARSLRSTLPSIVPCERTASRPRALSDDQLATLLLADSTSLSRAIEHATMVLTLARPEELRAATFGALSDDASRLSLFGGGGSISSVKSRHRFVPVHHRLRRLLQWWRQGGFAIVFSRSPTDRDHLFPSERGTLRTRRRSERIFSRELASASLPPVSLYALRNAGTRLLSDAGACDTFLAAMTGAERGGAFEVEQGEFSPVIPRGHDVTAHYARITLREASAIVDRVRVDALDRLLWECQCDEPRRLKITPPDGRKRGREACTQSPSS